MERKIKSRLTSTGFIFKLPEKLFELNKLNEN